MENIMRKLSDNAVARTLSIPERNKLKQNPKISENDSFMHIFRQLSIFKNSMYHLDELLSPLCTLKQLESLSHEDSESLSERMQNHALPEWSTVFERWARTIGGESTSGHHGLLSIIENHVTAATQELRTTLVTEHGGYGEKLSNVLADSIPVDILTQIVAPSTLLVNKRDYSDKSMQEYYAILGEPSVRDAIYTEFPVIARLVTEVLIDWIEASTKLGEHLIQDKSLLLREFGFDVSRLSRITANLGDRHNNGQTVAVLESDMQKVVYKPRNAFGERLIYRVCKLLPELNDLLPHIPVTFEKDDYLWQEFFAAKDFEPRQAPVIAKKLGVLNAILYYLLADDMHHENILISGENVIVVDAECVLNTTRPIDFMTIDVENVGAKVLADAAYTVGIVPQRVNSKVSGANPLDISVIGYKPGGTVELNVPQIHSTPDGGYSLINGPAQFNEKDPITHRHLLLQYGSDFLEGFKLAAILMMNRKEKILDTVLSSSELVVRVLPRPTMVYSKILLESFHPTFMRDAALRDACLGKLLPRYFGKSYRRLLIREEMAALRGARIPYTELDLRNNSFVIESHRFSAECGGVNRIINHILDIDEDEIHRQCAYIDMSFASTILKSSLPVESIKILTKTYSWDCTRYSQKERLEEHIFEGLENVMNLLIRHRGNVGFATMNALTPDCWVLGPAGMDLYNGLAGIHLMFERVRHEPFAEKFLSLYDEIEHTGLLFGDAVSLDKASVDKNVQALNVGLFDQLAGIAVSQYLSLQQVKHRERASESLKRTLSMLTSMVPYDKNYDVISGSAGSIFLANSLPLDYQEAVNKLIRQSIDKILSAAQVTADGAFWPAQDSVSGLTGLSHGASGIAAALAVGGKASKYRVEECAEMIGAALEWERRHFDFEKGWEDLREESQSKEQSEQLQAWCHGTGGAYIARQIIADNNDAGLSGDQRRYLDQELQYAVRKLAKKTLEMVSAGTSDCLCHGTVGNLLILQRATIKGMYSIDEFNAILSATLSRAERDGWRFGGIPGIPSNSFMMGMPGIVWGLASLYSPVKPNFDPFLLGV
ncbi:type 2 lanthipeptide synthetase LanM [Mobiluncus mulieris]|uniref:type 2 lanthipeptide synthetase LanM n=1 Tax=Mobiluncus mulieris TaxID=2052 RepID=UPI0021E24F40|nr:type 2 lanthipeptide synthetase LanM [Mobiluncus mulieris]